MTCGKKLFRSEAAARKVATGTANYGKGTKTRQRPYFCPECRGYHLSTGEYVARRDRRR
jgi:hypothetical protein